MTIKLVVGEYTRNVVSAYAPQAGLDEEVKRRFWEGLDEIVRGIPPAESLLGGDFDGHIGSTTGGYGEVHGGFNFGDRNGGGISPLDFTKAFELVIANSSFRRGRSIWLLSKVRRRRRRLIISSSGGVVEGCTGTAKLYRVRP
ncbi:PREDICTED: uncharacterized protein LOC109243688 [Nicotiana attenuata]|uniref:uncharacterized protein LOC109243688 n=1 Tax=Nicotiana attenuata TaxID=49451 RepID=UPI000905C986|nr:PREDICTED: uncharacterized protein LOC109243688 [Nicotiana attenuata]